MKHKIFFSWQSDTPNRVGRSLIGRALECSVGILQIDSDIEEAIREGLENDSDTKGVPGSPPIVDTIFKKIDDAEIFVADLTFCGNRRNGDLAPNPNVLIEYGWALKSRGYNRIVCIMNTAYGDPKVNQLPFDMRHLRHPVQFDCPEDADDSRRAKAIGDLAGKLAFAFK